MCDKVLPVDPEEQRLHLDPIQRHHLHQRQERQREERHLGQLRPQVRGWMNSLSFIRSTLSQKLSLMIK